MKEKHISRIGQVQVYTITQFRLFKNEKRWKVFLSTALITILISFVTSDEMFHEVKATTNGTFALVSAGIWIGIFNSLRQVCRERDILKREHRVGLHMSSYMAAHMLYGAFVCAVEALLVTGIVIAANSTYFPSDGVILPGFIEYFITMFLIIYGSNNLGLAISSAVRDENVAMTVMPFALIIQLIMAGLIFELEGIAEKISALTVSRWGLAAICSTSRVNDMMPGFYKDDYVSTPEHLTKVWLLMLAFAVLYGIIGTIFLEFVDKDKR